MKTLFLHYYQRLINQKQINFHLENALQEKMFGQTKSVVQSQRSWLTVWRWLFAVPSVIAAVVLSVNHATVNTSFLQLVQTAYAQEQAQIDDGKIHYQRYKAYLASDPATNTTVESWEVQQNSLLRRTTNTRDTFGNGVNTYKTVLIADMETNGISVYSNFPATGKMQVMDEVDLCAGEITANDPYVQIRSMVEVIKTESSTAAKKDILNKLAQSTTVEDLGESNNQHGLRIQQSVEVPVNCNESRSEILVTEYYFDAQTLQLKKEISGLQGEVMSVVEYLEEDYVEPTGKNLTVFDTTGLQLEL